MARPLRSLTVLSRMRADDVLTFGSPETLAKVGKYASDDSGSFINLSGHLLAFRHRSDSGT